MYSIGLAGELLPIDFAFQIIREQDADIAACLTDGAFEAKRGDVHGGLVRAAARIRLAVSSDSHFLRLPGNGESDTRLPWNRTPVHESEGLVAGAPLGS